MLQAGIVEQLADAIEAEVQELGGDELAEADILATVAAVQKVRRAGWGCKCSNVLLLSGWSSC